MQGCYKMLVPVYACPHCTPFGEYRLTICPYHKEGRRRVNPLDPHSERYLSCAYLQEHPVGDSCYLVCTNRKAIVYADPYYLPSKGEWESPKQFQADFDYAKEEIEKAQGSMLEDIKTHLYRELGQEVLKEIASSPRKESLVRVNLMGGSRKYEGIPEDLYRFVRLQAFVFRPKEES